MGEVAAGGDTFTTEIGAAGLHPDFFGRVRGAAAALIAPQTREQPFELPPADLEDLRPTHSFPITFCRNP